MTPSLKPWFSIATPHEDIREGRMEESVFAANLWAVVQKTAPPVYLDPEAFFEKTYMTEGLSVLLRRVAGSLGREEVGDRIVSLQTSFGGGKTHALVALWHIARHADRLRSSPSADDLRRSLGSRVLRSPCKVAVFTNATCDASVGRDAGEGIRTHTLWGELAYQLGGRSLYELVRNHDENLRVPQGIFVEVLRQSSPCLVLLDELADYCVGAAAVSVGETTLADQTISFIQQLTEAVQQVPGCVAVATLPASKEEVAQSEKGQEAFVTLERRFQRLGSDIKPVADEEIFEVVRRRLFESIAPKRDTEYPRKVAEAYQTLYSQHANEVPADVCKASYKERMVRSYPFHPSLIEALYTRWGSHPDFQRTRGVLRLLASVIGDLWQRRDNATLTQPLIQPSHIRWGIDAMQAALTRYWGQAYQSVVAADIFGPRSNSMLLDEERGGEYRKERIASGLASAILLGSFGGQGERSGFDAKSLRIACSRPGVNWNYADGALLELESRCFYLHSTSAGNLGKRYWFGTKANLNRLVVTYRQQVAGDDFGPDILESLRIEAGQGSLGGATWRIVVNPGGDLPEQKRLTLVVLPPSTPWSDDLSAKQSLIRQIRELSSKCGRTERRFRNTLLFLAATSKGLATLRQSYQERAALQGIKRDYHDQLDDEQKSELKRRIDEAEKTCRAALGPAYSIVLRLDGDEPRHLPLKDSRDSFAEHLDYLWSTLVDEEEWILRKVGSVTLQRTGLIPQSEGIRAKDAWEAFLRYTDKPMVASQTAVQEGIAQACRDGLLGIARGSSLGKLQSRHCGEPVAIDVGEEGLWLIPPFVSPQKTTGSAQPLGAEGAGPHLEASSTLDASTGPTSAGGKQNSLGVKIRQFNIRGVVPIESWADIFRSFVTPSARLHLRRVNLGIQFEMEADESDPLPADSQVLKNMREAAKQLGLEFETKAEE